MLSCYVYRGIRDYTANIFSVQTFQSESVRSVVDVQFEKYVHYIIFWKQFDVEVKKWSNRAANHNLITLDLHILPQTFGRNVEKFTTKAAPVNACAWVYVCVISNATAKSSTPITPHNSFKSILLSLRFRVRWDLTIVHRSNKKAFSFFFILSVKWGKWNWNVASNRQIEW